MGSTARGLRYPEPTDRLNQVAQNIEDLAGDVEALVPARVGWTSYDPMTTGAGPIMLNATKRGRYSVRDKLVTVQISGHYYPGAAGTYRFALPAGYGLVAGHAVALAVGSAWVYDFSTSQRYAGTVVIPAGAGHAAIWSTGTNPWGDTGGASAPITWDPSNDQISLSFSYETA
jgi:hypothetical protein